jgi:hypothetical protein
MGFGVADVARPAQIQIKDAHGPGESAFNTGAGPVAGLRFVRLLPGAGGSRRPAETARRATASATSAGQRTKPRRTALQY